MRRLLVFVFLMLPALALAQTYPDQSDTHVVDLADMFTDHEEATLRDQLAALWADDETEMIVATLPSVAEYAGVQTIQEYTESLFDTWGIGDGTRNDGILMVIFAEDRELWIALGAGYNNEWNGLLSGIVQYRILPQFSDGNVSGGTSLGIDLIRDMIVHPFRAGQPVPEPIPAPEPTEGEGGGGGLAFMIFGAPVLGFFALVAFLARRNKKRLNEMVCESCGASGMDESSETVTSATQTSEGERKTTRTCRSCGHSTFVFATIPVLTASSSSSSSSSSSGSSGGGGAGGSW